jgi:hypothetical protein
MDEAAIQAHVRAINDCNQRGGRMLSLVDLIAAGTVNLPLAAYLAAAMRSGASLLVGAQRNPRPGDTCYLAHEINNAFYYAYIWGEEAQVFFSLIAQGHIVASNLHADTLAETHDLVCQKYGVERAHLDAVTLKIYLEVKRTIGWNVQRRVSRVYESNGVQDRLLWTSKRGTFIRQEPGESAIVSPEQEKEYAEFLTTLIRQDTRHIDEIRRRLVR